MVNIHSAKYLMEYALYKVQDGFKGLMNTQQDMAVSQVNLHYTKYRIMQKVNTHSAIYRIV